MGISMSRIRAAALVMIVAAAWPAARAETVHPGQALASARQCLGCHQVDARRVGPPFTAIAARFAGQPGARDYLAEVIRKGSTGQWGAIPMPAQPRVSETDARVLAAWILSLGAER
ncbi:c-type cytochrome [Castellaniella sp. GW247-6E4]|uniref:c-type cytochrome n=1 Tax=Castellaniella sp. GW247-6E4 TaxID=3140380 RepID=UPI003315D8DE